MAEQAPVIETDCHLLLRRQADHLLALQLHEFLLEGVNPLGALLRLLTGWIGYQSRALLGSPPGDPDRVAPGVANPARKSNIRKLGAGRALRL
jgi:hypothetical protein